MLVTSNPTGNEPWKAEGLTDLITTWIAWRVLKGTNSCYPSWPVVYDAAKDFVLDNAGEVARISMVPDPRIPREVEPLIESGVKSITRQFDRTNELVNAN